MVEDIKKLSFEEAFAELEIIIGKMESGDIKLESSVSFYERGIALKNHCEGLLKSAQLKIEKIQIKPLKDGEVEITTVPFEIK